MLVLCRRFGELAVKGAEALIERLPQGTHVAHQHGHAPRSLRADLLAHGGEDKRLRLLSRFQVSARAAQEGEVSARSGLYQRASLSLRASALARSHIDPVVRPPVRLRPPGNFLPSVRRRSTHLRRPSAIEATTRALPSCDFGPVDAP